MDRAALDAAIELGIEQGGFCPAGRIAEDGRISDNYLLTETESTDSAIRTEANVLTSDGTLLIYQYQPLEGSILTRDLCRQHGKPLFELDIPGLDLLKCKQDFSRWLEDNCISILNIAGNRESSRPVYKSAKDLLLTLLK